MEDDDRDRREIPPEDGGWRCLFVIGQPGGSRRERISGLASVGSEFVFVRCVTISKLNLLDSKFG